MCVFFFVCVFFFFFFLGGGGGGDREDPIHTALNFININIFRPDIEANCSVNFDNSISSSRMFIPCMFSF